MPEVLVVGSGTAGMAAAEECSRRGLDVTVVDRLDGAGVPWAYWPDLLVPGVRLETTSCLSARKSGLEPVFDTEVVTVRRGETVTSEGAVIRARSVVLATGSRPGPTAVQGVRKAGSYVLDSPGRYSEFGSAASRADRVLVCGEGTRGFQVAERLSATGSRPSLVVSSWQSEEPSPPVLEVISDAALERGIAVTKGRVDRVFGLSRAEAVTVGGRVVSCDAFAYVPRRVPAPVPLAAPPGRSGGILVDRLLRTREPGVYAVGGCAELEGSLPPLSTLGEEPRLSGRAAGANAAGASVGISRVRCWSLAVLGLRWSRSGPGAKACRSLGMRVREAHGRQGSRAACTLVYEEATGRVIGAEVVEPADSSSGGLCSWVPGSATLKSLAYGGLGSSDISMVSDTARVGLASWSGY